MAIGSDKKIDNLNDKIDLFIEGTITFNKNIEEPIPLLKNVITLNESLSKNGSILLWVSLNKPKEIYPKVYILDIGDSLIKNRMSLFIDKYGFLNWRIIDSSLVEHTLKTDINRFLNGTKFMITATWNNDGNLNLYINNLKPIHNRLDYFDLKIESKELYLYSDIHGDYKIKPIHN